MKKDYRISRATVEGLNEAEYFWALIKPIWPDSSVKDEHEHISYGTPGQRALYVTSLFLREVDSGGIEQFFWNSSSLYSYEVLEGFKLLGMTEYYDTLKKALTFFPNSKVPDDWIERQKYMHSRKDDIESFFEPLNEILYNEERIYSYFHRYITEHPQDFFVENESNGS